MFKCCSESKTVCLGCGCVGLSWNMLSSFALFQFVNGLVLVQLPKPLARLPYQAVLLVLTASVRLRATTPPTGSSNTCWSYMLSDSTLPCQPEFAFADRQLVAAGPGSWPDNYVILRELVLFQPTLCFSDVNVLLVYFPSSQQKSPPSQSLCRSRNRGKAMPQNDCFHIAEHIRADLIKLHVWKWKS